MDFFKLHDLDQFIAMVSLFNRLMMHCIVQAIVLYCLIFGRGKFNHLKVIKKHYYIQYSIYDYKKKSCPNFLNLGHLYLKLNIPLIMMFQTNKN